MRLLVVIGAGYGNTIFTTPLIRALHELGHWVDVLFDGEYPDLDLIFKNTNYAVCIASKPEDLPIPTSSYDAVLNTLWAKNNHNNSCQLFSSIKHERVYHEAMINYDMATQLGHLGPMPSAFFADVEWANCEDYIAISIPIQKSLNWERKSYPNWLELIKLLGENVLLLGTKEEVALWEGYCNTLATNNVYEYAHCVAKAKCFIGTDNGPSHIASVIGCPSVIIYGGTGIAKNLPLGPRSVAVITDTCTPCQYTNNWNTCQTPGRCMDISPQTIMAYVKEVLDESL